MLTEQLPQVVGLLTAVVLMNACASEPSAKSAPASSSTKTELERFMPLEHDTVYSYETYSETKGERGVLVLRVRRPHDDVAELDVAGRVQELHVSESALELATGGFLLVSPLKAGAQWQGDFGTVRVTATDKTITVPAGRFSGCLETVEALSSPQVRKRTITVFCPDVGIVARDTEGEAGAETLHETLKLKSYGEAFSPDLK